MAFQRLAKLAAISFSLSTFSTFGAFAADLDQTSFDERFTGAVSEINGKIEVGGFHTDFSFDPFGFFGPAFFDSAEGYFIQGAISAPISENFGAQLDVGYLDSDLNLIFGPFNFDFTATGFAGHVFWRDATVGLLGLYASKTTYDIGFPFGPTAEIDNVRVGVEAEAYFDRITFKGFLGADRAKFPFFLGPIGPSLSETYVAAKGEVGFYMTDNFVLKAGFDHSFETTSAKLGAEALFDMGGASPSFFVDGSFNDDETTIMAGLKIYFGGASKSLIRRHREDDPEIDLFKNVGAVASCLSKQGSGIPLRGIPIGARAAYAMPTFSLDGCNVRASMDDYIMVTK